jgi:hypothetical protein
MCSLYRSIQIDSKVYPLDIPIMTNNCHNVLLTKGGLKLNGELVSKIPESGNCQNYTIDGYEACEFAGVVITPEHIKTFFEELDKKIIIV